MWPQGCGSASMDKLLSVISKCPKGKDPAGEELFHFTLDTRKNGGLQTFTTMSPLGEKSSTLDSNAYYSILTTRPRSHGRCGIAGVADSARIMGRAEQRPESCGAGGFRDRHGEAGVPQPLRRAFGIVRVWRAVGGEEFADSEYRWLPAGRRHVPEGTRHSRAALAGRMFRRRLPLARRDRSSGEAAEAREPPLGRVCRRQQFRHS